MLHLDKILIAFSIFGILFSCNISHDNQVESTNNDVLAIKKSKQIVGEDNYFKIYKVAEDSLNNWILHELLFDKKLNVPNYKIDSVICFDSKGNRLIGALHQTLNKKAWSDQINVFLGEKIDDKWYFFTTDGISIPRSMFKNHDLKKPLTYAQMHSEALNNIFGNYGSLTYQEIELWFDGKFEGVDWGRFENRYQNDWILNGNKIDNEADFYKYIHKQKALKIWAQKAYRDSIAKLKIEKSEVL